MVQQNSQSTHASATSATRCPALILSERFSIGKVPTLGCRDDVCHSHLRKPLALSPMHKIVSEGDGVGTDGRCELRRTFVCVGEHVNASCFHFYVIERCDRSSGDGVMVNIWKLNQRPVKTI